MNTLNDLKTWNRENMSGWRWLALWAMVMALLYLMAGVAGHKDLILLALLLDLKHDVDHLTTTDAEVTRS